MTAWNLIAALLLVNYQEAPQAPPPAKPAVIIVVGAAGTPEFGEQFKDWAAHWRSAAEKASADFSLIGEGEASKESDRDLLKAALAKLVGPGDAPVWLVFIGHGTFDGLAAKFNLRGPDLVPTDLVEWLKPVERPVAVVNSASASAPFLNKLAGAGRVVITATRSGNEQNFAHFGQYISAAVNDLTADLDKDNQVSLLEAYLTACRQLDEFYKQESRLATEHALLDDNGDGLGTPAAWFRGLRATQRAKEGASLDGTRAHQLHLVKSASELAIPPEVAKRRDELEMKVAALRLEKDKLKEDEYYNRLRPMMVELAQVYKSLELPKPADTPPAPVR